MYLSCWYYNKDAHLPGLYGSKHLHSGNSDRLCIFLVGVIIKMLINLVFMAVNIYTLVAVVGDVSYLLVL